MNIANCQVPDVPAKSISSLHPNRSRPMKFWGKNQQRTPIFFTRPSIVFIFKFRNASLFFLSKIVFKNWAIVIFKNKFLLWVFLSFKHRWALMSTLSQQWEKSKGRHWKNGYDNLVHVQCHHLHEWVDACVCKCKRDFRSILILGIYESSRKHHMEWSFSWTWWERNL